MNKEEFCNLTGTKYEGLDEKDWNIINKVYAFHPMISDLNGKDEIAALYLQGGMGLMMDMAISASYIEDREAEVQRATVEKERIKKDFDEKLKALNAWFVGNNSTQDGIIETASLAIVKITERYKS